MINFRKNKTFKVFGENLYSMLGGQPGFRRGYLRFATFLSNHGINPPLAPRKNRLMQRWAEQGTAKSDVSPDTYTKFDNSIERLFQDVLPLLKHNSSILEIGCNSGRSLDYLFHKGFHNLTGIEIGTKAVELFAQAFPDTYDKSKIIVGDAVKEVQKLETDAFDLVFTHSVLVSISAKDNSIFREMSRICRGYILILENEGSWTAYPRSFQRMFKKCGYIMVSYRWLEWNEAKNALRFPKRITDESIFENNTIRLFASSERT